MTEQMENRHKRNNVKFVQSRERESGTEADVKMYCEWPITLNCVIITALLFPFLVISAVIILICVMTALLSVLRTNRALVFSESWIPVLQ